MLFLCVLSSSSNFVYSPFITQITPLKLPSQECVMFPARLPSTIYQSCTPFPNLVPNHLRAVRL